MDATLSSESVDEVAEAMLVELNPTRDEVFLNSGPESKELALSNIVVIWSCVLNKCVWNVLFINFFLFLFDFNYFLNDNRLVRLVNFLYLLLARSI